MFGVPIVIDSSAGCVVSFCIDAGGGEADGSDADAEVEISGVLEFLQILIQSVWVAVTLYLKYGLMQYHSYNC